MRASRLNPATLVPDRIPDRLRFLGLIRRNSTLRMAAVTEGDRSVVDSTRDHWVVVVPIAPLATGSPNFLFRNLLLNPLCPNTSNSQLNIYKQERA